MPTMLGLFLRGSTDVQGNLRDICFFDEERRSSHSFLKGTSIVNLKYIDEQTEKINDRISQTCSNLSRDLHNLRHDDNKSI